jgi:Peptidase family S41/N-terminal domain of Peptidase_S41 in eukaryotic IRBP
MTACLESLMGQPPWILNANSNRASLFGALLLIAFSVHAQEIQAGLDEVARRAVVQNAAEAIRQRYVYPESGDRAAEAIKAALAAGNYDAEDPAQFARQLTEDLQSETHDKHVYVIATGPNPPANASLGQPVPPRQENGVVRADRLPNNIGYIELVAFPELSHFKPTLDRAMAALMSTRALVIDMRRNHGGDARSEVYLASYFVDAKKGVIFRKFMIRNPGTDSFRTQLLGSMPTPGTYTDKPIYVLTSRYSASAGEALGYDLHSLKLAVIVGETTAGGANAGVWVHLGHNMSMFVATAKVEIPATGTNFDGGGVGADVSSAANQALKVALNLLGVPTDQTHIADLSKSRLFEPR